MRTLFFAAASTAMFALLLSVVPDDADARGRSQARAAKTASAKMGGCGTYMYWKGGRCMDARNKKK